MQHLPGMGGASRGRETDVAQPDQGCLHPGRLTIGDACHFAFQMLKLGQRETPFELLGQAVAEYVYDHFREGDTDEPLLLLSRVWLIQPVRDQFPSLLRSQSKRSEEPAPDDTRRECVLIGTCGQMAEWCEVSLAGSDRTLIWDNQADLQRARPIVARICQGLREGLPHHEQLHEGSYMSRLDQIPTCVDIQNVWDDPLCPEHTGEKLDGFAYRSVVGIGVSLPSGHQLVMTLYTQIPIPKDSGSAYRILALTMYLIFLNAVITEERQPAHVMERAALLSTSYLHTTPLDHPLKRGLDNHADLVEFQVGEHPYGVRSESGALRYLINRTLMAEELFRRQLSLDLHDQLTAKLGAVIFGLGFVVSSLPQDDHSTRFQLLKYRDELLRVSAWARSKSHEIHPSFLSGLGFEGALRRIALDNCERLQIPGTVHMTGPIDSELDDVVASSIYQVVQEALRNTEKHAHASSVHIGVRGDDMGVHVSIVDDGIGFSPQAMSQAMRGIGLIGMRERIQMINGFCTISSAPGCGTQISMWVPHRTDWKAG